jgi:hypothetical protein
VFAVSFLMGKKKPRTDAGLFVFWLTNSDKNENWSCIVMIGNFRPIADGHVF